MWSKRSLPSREAIGDYVLNCIRDDVYIYDADAEFSLRDITPVEKFTNEQLDEMGSQYCWGMKDGAYVLLYSDIRGIREAVRLAGLYED